MFAYPVLPAILPQHLLLGSITLVTLIGILVCTLGLRRGRSRGAWLIASLLGTAFVLFVRWHRYPPYPERPHDTFLREAIAWTNFLSWFLLVAVSVAHSRRHPDSRKVIAGTWTCVVPALLLWMPVCVYPRSAAQSSSCRSQLKMLGIATSNYAETYDGRYFPLRLNTVAGVERSWRVEVLPFLDASALRKRYRDDAAWGAYENEPVAREGRGLYRCPSNERSTDALERVYTAYLAVGGDRGLFGAERRWDEVPDGNSNTALMVEACGQNVVWTEPRDIDIGTVAAGVNRPGAEPGRSEGSFSAYHPGGPGLLMADGSVRSVGPGMDPEVLRAVLTADGNEPVSFD